MQRQIATFNPTSLQPHIYPELARTLALAMVASLTVARGDRLAQLTANGKWTVANLTTITAPASGLTLSATGADGSLATGVVAMCYTYYNANGETTISPVATVTVGSTNHIVVAAITPLPTGATGAKLYMTDAGGHDFHLVKGDWDGTALNILAPVNSVIEPPTANTAFVKTDGSQVAKAISKFDFLTDTSGNVFYGQEVPTTGPISDAQPTAEAFISGYFLKSDLADLTAAEIASLGAKEFGVGSSAFIYIP